MSWIQVTAQEFEDILYHHGEGENEGIAKITINRPKVRNAFRPETIHELIDAFHHAHMDASIGVIILTGSVAPLLVTASTRSRRLLHRLPADRDW